MRQNGHVPTAGGATWESGPGDGQYPLGHVLVGDEAAAGRALRGDGWVRAAERENNEGRNEAGSDLHQGRSKTAEEGPRTEVPYRGGSGDEHQGGTKVAGDPEVFAGPGVYETRAPEGQASMGDTGAELDGAVDGGCPVVAEVHLGTTWQKGVHREY